jgi:hypothetical protein
MFVVLIGRSFKYFNGRSLSAGELQRRRQLCSPLKLKMSDASREHVRPEPHSHLKRQHMQLEHCRSQLSMASRLISTLRHVAVGSLPAAVRERI